MKRLLLLLVCLLSGFASAQDGTIFQVQNNGVTVFTGKKYVRINCTPVNTCTYASGTITFNAAGGSVSTTGTPASSYCTYFTAAATLTGTANCTLDSSGNFIIAGSITSGSGGTGSWLATEGASPGTAAASKDLIYADSTAHRFKMQNNNGTAVQVVGTGGDIGTSDQLLNLNVNATAADYVAGGGTAQAQTATLSPALSANTTGVTLKFLPVAANTATAPTLAVNGLTAKTITKCGTVPLAPSDLLSTSPAEVIYDGTEWVLQNPYLGCSQANGGFLSSGYTGTGAAGAIAANNGKLWSFSVQAPIAASTKLVYGIQTLDNSANVYNIAILDSAKNILCQTGAVAGTTFSPSTGVNKTLSWTAACSPLVPGTQYYLLYTGNAVTAVLDGLAATEENVCNITSGANTSASAVITTANVTIPANSLTNCTYPNFGIF